MSETDFYVLILVDNDGDRIDLTLSTLVSQSFDGSVKIAVVSPQIDTSRMELWSAFVDASLPIGLTKSMDVVPVTVSEQDTAWERITAAIESLKPDPASPLLILEEGDILQPRSLQIATNELERMSADALLFRSSFYGMDDGEVSAVIGRGLCDDLFLPALRPCEVVLRSSFFTSTTAPAGLAQMKFSWFWRFMSEVSAQTNLQVSTFDFAHPGQLPIDEDRTGKTLIEIDATMLFEERLEAFIGFILEATQDKTTDDPDVVDGPTGMLWLASQFVADAITRLQQDREEVPADLRGGAITRLLALNSTALSTSRPLSEDAMRVLEAQSQYNELMATVDQVNALLGPLDSLAKSCRDIVFSYDRPLSTPRLDASVPEQELLERLLRLAPGKLMQLARSKDLDKMNWKKEFRRKPFDFSHWRAVRRFQRRRIR